MHIWLFNLLLQQSQEANGWDWLWRLANSAAILVIIGWLGQWVVPRVRRARDKAEVAEKTANAAKTTVDAAKGQFELYDEQLRLAWERITTLETKDTLRIGLMKKLEDKYNALERLHEKQSERMGVLEEHIDDLYNAINQEPDGGKRIRDRLTTKRPNGKHRKGRQA